MLTIGVVNNMAVPAIASTERQFSDILHEAADGCPVQLHWYRFGGPCPDHYQPISALLQGGRIDGLIVTGAEPKAERLPDEPLWAPLIRTLEWAQDNASSAILSCLAAHAAVHYLDGINRQSHSEKIFGIFESHKLTDHTLLSGTPEVWRVPHSRWNDLPEHALVEAGYTILTKSREAGVDLFIKRLRGCLFFFIQTHPEYHGRSLLRELLRDVDRYARGQQTEPPSLPRHYLDNECIVALRALLTSDQNLYAQAYQLLEGVRVSHAWKPIAVQIYRNWIQHLVEAREVVA